MRSPSSRLVVGLQWLIGVLGLVGLGFLVNREVERALATEELAVEMPAVAAFAGPGDLPDSFAVSPGRVRERLTVHLDGKPRDMRIVDLAPDGEHYRVETALDGALGPGFHLLEFRPGYGQPEPRAAAIGFVTGPFAGVDAWCPRGLQVVVAQPMLDQMERLLERMIDHGLAKRLAGKDGKPRDIKSSIELRISDSGLGIRGSIAVDGTRAEFATQLAISVDPKGRLRLTREGQVEANVAGKLVNRSRWMAAGAGAGAGALAGPWGALGGALIGVFNGNRLVEHKARGKLNALIDRQLCSLEDALETGSVISLGETARGAKLQIRVAKTPEIIPDREIRLDIDLRVLAAKSSRGPVPGPFANGVIPPAARPSAKQPLAVTASVDAFNRVLHGLWLSGALDETLNDPALTRRVRKALESTVFEIDAVHLATPPMVVGDERDGLKAILPRLEVTLHERERGGGEKTVALFNASAVIRATLDPGRRTIDFWLDAPTLSASCRREVVAGKAVFYPCLSELLDLGRARMDRLDTTKKPLFSLGIDHLLPLGGDGEEEIRLHLRNLTLALPKGKEQTGLVLRTDVRVD